MLTGTVSFWKNSHGYIRPDRSLEKSSIRFSKRWLMTEDYQPKCGDRVSFGLNPGASKRIRYATYVAKIEENADVDQSQNS